jgi:hypothetical protein
MRWLLNWMIVVGVMVSTVGAAENGVLELLTSEGVTLGDGTVIKLPASTLADGVGVDAEQNLLRQAAGRHSLDQFLRKSRVAPFNLKISSVKNQAGARTGQVVDIWFVAYGTLVEIEEHDLLKDLANPGPQKEQQPGRKLTADELADRDIEVSTVDGKPAEHYLVFEGPLMDRVQLSGVLRTAETRGDGSLVVALVMDERFADDEKHPNQWRPLKANELGKLVAGDPQPYSGSGAYLKVTELAEPAGAMLFEMHVAFNEPHGWFDGANLLRSKLPIIVQENVRKLRGKLERIGN